MISKGSRLYLWTLIGILIISFIVLSLLAPETFPTFANITSMMFQMSDVGILALGIGIAFLIGGIDLSVVAVSNLAGVTAAATMSALQPDLGAVGAVLVAVAAALAIGVSAGLINGLLVSRLQVHPIVITLGTLTLFTGIGTGLTGGSTVFATGAMTPLGRGLLAGLVPVPFLIFVAISAVLALITTKTRFGFRAHMVGASEVASRYGRLPVARVQIATYITSGVLAAFAGLIVVARTNAANVSFGSSFLVLAILVAVLAGIDPYGGSGRIFLVVLSMAAMQQLSTGLNMVLAGWGGATFAREFAWGVLLIAVLGWGQLAPQSSPGRLLASVRGGGGDRGSGPDSGQESAGPAGAGDVSDRTAVGVGPEAQDSSDDGTHS